MEKDFTVDNLLKLLNEKVPLEWSEDWDNSGLQIGELEHPIKKIVIALNPDIETVKFASRVGADVLITHHPLFFKGIKTIKKESWPGNVVYEAIENKLNIIALHTNFDKASFGISANLARILNWPITGPIIREGEWGLGVTGKFSSPLSIARIAKILKAAFNFSSLRLVGDFNKEVFTYALCGGSCGSIWKKLREEGIDLFITSDVKYHDMLEGEYSGIAIISLDHSIEKFGFFPLRDLLDDWIKKIFSGKIEIDIFEAGIDIKWV